MTLVLILSQLLIASVDPIQAPTSLKFSNKLPLTSERLTARDLWKEQVKAFGRSIVDLDQELSGKILDAIHSPSLSVEIVEPIVKPVIYEASEGNLTLIFDPGEMALFDPENARVRFKSGSPQFQRNSEADDRIETERIRPDYRKFITREVDPGSQKITLYVADGYFEAASKWKMLLALSIAVLLDDQVRLKGPTKIERERAESYKQMFAPGTEKNRWAQDFLRFGQVGHAEAHRLYWYARFFFVLFIRLGDPNQASLSKSEYRQFKSLNLIP